MKIKEWIKRYRNNKDVKILIENFVSLSLLKLVGYIFPLITMPYLARVIGIESFGAIAFASSIVVYFQTFTDFGFNYTATRDIAQCKNNINMVSRIFSNIMVTRILLLFICTIVFAVCVYAIPFLHEQQMLLWLTFLSVPGYIIFPEWFFQAMEKMKYITIMNVLVKLIFTILIFVFIKEKSDYIYQPLLIAVGYWISGIIALWIIVFKFRIKFVMPSFLMIWQTLKSGCNMFLSLFLPNFYTSFSLILLRSWSGNYAVGIYSSGYRFIELADQLSGIVSRTFYPFLARRIDKHDLYVKFVGAINVVACVGLFFGADLLVRVFYSSEFAAAAVVIRIMSIAPFFCFLMDTYGPNYLVLIGKERILRNIILSCSIVGCLASCLFINYFNYIGVATVIIIIWGTRGMLTYFYAKKYRING